MKRRQIDVGFRQNRRSQAAALLEQSKQQMLHVDLLLAVPRSQRLRFAYPLLELFCKSVEVHFLDPSNQLYHALANIILAYYYQLIDVMPHHRDSRVFSCYHRVMALPCSARPSLFGSD